MSLDEGKTKYTLFNVSKNKDNMPLKPSKVYLNQKETKMKIFHGIIIYLIEHKITKNIRILT